MTRIYVTQPQSRVAVRGGKVIVSVDGEVKKAWPIDAVRSIVCWGTPSFTPYAMEKFLDGGIEVHLMTRGGRYRGSLGNDNQSKVLLQMAQFNRWQDAAFRLEVARGIVREKVANQERLLREKGYRRPNAGLRSLAGSLKALEPAIDAAETVQVLMGIEGTASRLYFEGFAEMITRDVPFHGRSRRPPLDPPNALLSLGYTLVGNEIAGLLEAEGFQVRLGFLHSFRYGRASLALDILEAVRQPLVDRWVLSLLNLRRLGPSDFEARDGGVFLAREAGKRFLAWYGEQMGDPEDAKSWRAHIVHRVDAFRDAILDGDVARFTGGGRAEGSKP